MVMLWLWEEDCILVRQRIATTFILALTLLLLVVGSHAFAQQNARIGSLFDRVLSTETDPQDMRLYLAPLAASDLEALADAVQDELQSGLMRSIGLKLELAEAPVAQRASITRQSHENASYVYDLAAKYRRVLNAWDDRGGDAEAILPHRRFLWSLVNNLVRTTDFRALAVLLGDWVMSPTGGFRAIFQMAAIVAWLAALFAVAAIAQRWARRRMDRSPNASILLRKFLARSAFWVTLAAGLLIMLSIYGVRISPLLAVFGGVSIIVGLALQDTIGNVASGLMIMLNRSFDIGDFVRAGNQGGRVEVMSLTSTRIRTPDNQVIQIPNTRLWSDVIVNASASATRRVDLVFGISYSEDARRAIKLLERIVDANPLCLSEPKREVFLGELGESSVSIFCRPWVATPDYWPVFWGLTAAAKEAFDAEGIAIPYPQVDIHIRT